MDYSKMSIDEIQQGYHFDETQGRYLCNYCGQSYREGQVYPFGEDYLLAEPSMLRHIEDEHTSAFKQNIEGGSKYNTLTDTQRELLVLFERGMADTEIANKLGIKASTVRHQKFTFREKAKQAKYYLAIYNDALDRKAASSRSDDIVEIPNSATMMDDRYIMTEQEKQGILKAEFESLDPLRLKKFPIKAKKQVAVLSRVAEEFEFGRKYSYAETKEKLSAISEDYNALSRYLVDYGFMDRTKDGSEYWLK